MAHKIVIGVTSDVAQAAWVNHFWRHYFALVNEREDTKYLELTMLIKVVLTLFHGSADVGRGFSRSGRICGEDQALMSEDARSSDINSQTF
ncbi:hypothetical protein QYM36_013815 [Artemia franciscana]|uniref:Uncharacterized protein n=1 Tax=Artemia franciscana TaxID=6661 RepID=A0AA88KZ70_ARTSF|nr:hypothetical protein QYM36_013815 [Artemia franciscana]